MFRRFDWLLNRRIEGKITITNVAPRKQRETKEGGVKIRNYQGAKNEPRPSTLYAQ
jgi:hypothetical protein